MKQEHDGMDLLQEIQNRIEELNVLPKRLWKYKKELAEAEHTYKILVNEKALKLKDEGMPVTLINLTIYGYKEVAEARLKRDIANSLVEACEESININKLILRLLESQMNREWR